MTKKIPSMNKQQGGSYIKDPKTGITRLVHQTQQREITRLDSLDEQNTKSEPDVKSNKKAESKKPPGRNNR